MLFSILQTYKVTCCYPVTRTGIEIETGKKARNTQVVGSRETRDCKGCWNFFCPGIPGKTPSEFFLSQQFTEKRLSLKPILSFEFTYGTRDKRALGSLFENEIIEKIFWQMKTWPAYYFCPGIPGQTFWCPVVSVPIPWAEPQRWNMRKNRESVFGIEDVSRCSSLVLVSLWKRCWFTSI